MLQVVLTQVQEGLQLLTGLTLPVQALCRRVVVGAVHSIDLEVLLLGWEYESMDVCACEQIITKLMSVPCIW